VAGGLILFESVRSRRKEAAKQESIVDDISALQDEIEWLKRQLKERQLLHEEYHLPENMKPSILKLSEENQSSNDTNGKTIQTIGTSVDGQKRQFTAK
jgi:hypothetical protein